MAIVDNAYAVTSQGPTILNQGLFEASSTQKYALGHTLRLNDGRVFKYAKAGADLTPGKLLQTPASTGSSDFFNCAIAENGTSGGRIGDTTLTVTLNGSTHALAANALADGWVQIATSTGAGRQYKVLSNTAASAGGTTTITLAEPLQAAIGASSTATLALNQYNGVITRPATGTGAPVGIAPIAVSSGQYFWLQTYGRATCLQDGAWSVNTQLVPSNGVDGAAEVQVAGTSGTVLPIIGFACKVGADGLYGDLILTLEA
mgnify:CR=1 FL=1